MTSIGSEGYLNGFQETGSLDSLFEYVRASKRDEQRYREAADALAPIFEALQFGEQPQYDRLDANALRARMSEVEDIATWMAHSSKADLKSTGLELMGFLGWDSFLSCLEESASSEADWERLTAINALAQVPTPRAAEALKAALEDSDPQVRRAAKRALEMS
ncbi:MAG TPA: HEAT repeat domain-containing protein [Chloroflexia bacterium]|jgi:HEAT repeat protein